ncbi:MAG: protein-export chaperone SecB [Pseudomonadota bacterium]|nr:protein-export chaperone SecB [Pseudomonadota bacterium]
MADSNQTQGPSLNVEKIYVKDISYEAPSVPQAFLEQKVPEVGIQLQIAHSQLSTEEGLHEVVLSVTVTAKLQDRTLFLAEVQQGGLFRIAGIASDEMPMVIEIGCPNILLPFAREVINDLVGKGGFPQLLINPVNFELLYQQKLAANGQPVSH